MQTLGWIGAVLILLAYALNLFGKMNVRSVGYNMMNIVGALGIVLASAERQSWPAATLNAIWMVIGLVGLFRILTAKEKGTPNT